MVTRLTDCGDRIQHRAFGIGQRAFVDHRKRCGDRTAAADETHAVRLEGDLGVGPMHGHQVKHPRHLLFARAWASSTENCTPPLDDLGLHEQIAERRVQRVRVRRRKNHFRVARDVDRTSNSRPVCDVDPAHLDIVDRGYHDLCVRLEVEIPAPKLGAPFGKDRFVVFGRLERRLIRGRPELPARLVAQITERAPVVGGAVFAPTRHGEILPATASTTCVGDHHVIAAVRQQLHLRNRRVWIGEHAHGQLSTDVGRVQVSHDRPYWNETVWPLGCAPGAEVMLLETAFPIRSAVASGAPTARMRRRASSSPGGAP